MKKCSLLVFALLISLILVTACNLHGGNGKKNNDEDVLLTPEKVSTSEAATIIKENKGNENFILLDVRSNGEFHEGYLTGHLEKDENREDNDPYKYGGVLHHNIEAKDFDEWISHLDKKKRYLIYCRTQNRSKKAFDKLKALGFKKIQYMHGGYTDWAKEGRDVEHFDLKNAIDILIKGDKIKTKSTISFDFEVTDLHFNGLRKPKIHVEVYKDATKVETKTIDADAHGKATYKFDATSKPQGSYRLVCKPEYKGNTGEPYESVEAYYYFEVADEDEMVQGSSNEITTTDKEFSKIKERVYNRNIYGYKVFDRQKQVVTLESQLKSKSKPVLLIFFSPKCGGCMTKAQELVKYNLDSIIVLPIITSIKEEEIKEEIEFTEDKFTNEFGLQDLVPSTLYDAKDFIFKTRFKSTVTPKFVLINKEGQIKDLIYELSVEDMLKKMEKMFKLAAFTKK